MWDLNNPTEPTYTAGSTLDRVLFIPGEYIPSNFTQPIEEDGIEEERVNPGGFPAVVLPDHSISDHYPILLSIPAEIDPSIPPDRRYALDDLSDEQWMERNEELSRLIEAERPGLRDSYSANNVHHYSQKIESLLTEVLKSDLQPTRPSESEDPIRSFLQAHKKRPDSPLLLQAFRDGDAEEANKLMNRMCKDGWKSFLRTVRRSNTRPFFDYLAKAEGRKRWGAVPTDSVPLFHKGEVIVSNKAKCALLAEAFGRKIGGPAQRGVTDVPRESEPLGTFRQIPGLSHNPITTVEIHRALKVLSPHKAPGPDRFPGIVYKRLTALIPLLRDLLNLIYKTGVIPKTLRRIHLIPVPKPGKDPHQLSSRRPISLLSTAIKLVEAVIYHRIIPAVEPRLAPEQYAYRRERGTEQHLTELLDAVHRATKRGKYCYIVSFDISGAFDNVSHRALMSGLEQMQVDPFSRRVVHAWLRDRTFQVKMRTSMGVYYSNIYDIGRGLPQGGVLSPLLWLAFFNPVPDKLRRSREGTEGGTAAYRDLIYADDITTLITADTLEELKKCACHNVAVVRETLRAMGLELNDSKTCNLLLNPALLTDGPFRRELLSDFPPTKARITSRYKREAYLLAEDLDYDPSLEEAIPTPEEVYSRGFPYRLAESVKVLGVLIDRYLQLDDQHTMMLSKARVRHSILSKVANSKWGLEAGTLKITYDAVVLSLLRYSLIFTGSCLPMDLAAKVDTRIVNISARKMLGVDATIRIESLHFLAGTRSYNNMYIMNCAKMIDACLRAHNSTIKSRLEAELCAVYHIDQLEPEAISISLPSTRNQTEYVSVRRRGLLQKTVWLCVQYKRRPNRPSFPPATSSYLPHAEELVHSLFYTAEVFNYAGSDSWFGVGLQALELMNWSPECSLANYHNVINTLPPNMHHLLTFRYKMDTGESRGIHRPDGSSRGRRSKKLRGLQIYTGGTVLDGMGATSCVVIQDNRIVYRGLYIHGRVITQERPRYLEEVAVLHSLRTLHDWFAQTQMEQEEFESPVIRAGDAKAIGLLENWFLKGKLNFETGIASPLIDDISRLDTWLRVPIVIMPFALPMDTERPTELPLVYGDVLQVIEEFRTMALPTLGPGWMESLPRIPLSKEETKDMIRHRHEEDELFVLRELSVLGSESAKIIIELELTREIVAAAMATLKYKRALQVTLASVLGATRFKRAFHGVLVPTRCPHFRHGVLCGREDSFAHLLDCYNLRGRMKRGVESVDFLVEMAKKVVTTSPGRSVPLYVL